MRLTNSMREDICARMIVRRFDKEQAKLDMEWKNLGEAIYRETYPPDVLKTLNTLPDGWVPITNRGLFHLPGGVIIRVPMHVSKPIPMCDECTPRLEIKVTHRLYKRWSKLKLQRERLQTQRNKVTGTITRALRPITTVKRLLELWPEAEPFVAETPTPQLPALHRQELNKALGLK